MTQKPLSILALALVASLAPAGPSARAEELPAEMRSEVPALEELHEVVAPLWHQAWPNKDYEKMKELLPEARAGVARVAEARLPQILHQRQANWDSALARLQAALADYEKAAAAGSDQGLLDAVEAFHSGFEGLVRATRPALKELDLFHVALYRVYHHQLPDQEWPALAASAERMADACTALAAAPVPSRFARREAELRPEIAALCEKSETLRATAAGTDRKATADAVEAVHSQYQKVEALLTAPAPAN